MEKIIKSLRKITLAAYLIFLTTSAIHIYGTNSTFADKEVSSGNFFTAAENWTDEKDILSGDAIIDQAYPSEEKQDSEAVPALSDSNAISPKEAVVSNGTNASEFPDQEILYTPDADQSGENGAPSDSVIYQPVEAGNPNNLGAN